MTAFLNKNLLYQLSGSRAIWTLDLLTITTLTLISGPKQLLQSKAEHQNRAVEGIG